MRFSSSVALAGLAGSVVAQEAAQNQSLCDKYTAALLTDNNAKNQYTVLTLLVNTVVIGNYTQPNMNAVPGILAKGMYEGTEVNLLPYFDGTLLSTNRGGDSGASVNFLDDGGAAPLMDNKPANGTESNQYFLLTHLYQFFGKLLECSGYDSMDFPKYGGDGMAAAHAFMNLNAAENGYFIQQVGLAATSFGVTTEDATAVGGALQKLFGYRCSPPAAVIPEQGETLNSICQAEDCPLDPNPQCSAYPNNGVGIEPMVANSTNTEPSSTSGSPSSSTSPTASASTSSPPESTGAASVVRAGMGIGAAALAFAVAL